MNGARCIAFACAIAIGSIAQAQSLVTVDARPGAGLAYIFNGNGGTGFKFRDSASAGSGYAIRRDDLERMEYGFSYAIGASGVAGKGSGYSVAYTPDENAGNAWMAGTRYANGPFSAGLAYTRLRHPAGVAALYPYPAVGVTAFLGQTVAVVDALTGAVTDFYAASPLALGSQSIVAMGAQWKAGSIALAADITSSAFQSYGRPFTMRAFELGGTMQLAPAWLSAIGYQHTSFEDTGWHQLTAGVAYGLSNRAAVYVSGDYLQASGNTRAAVGYSFAPPGSNRQADIRMGMRMRF